MFRPKHPIYATVDLYRYDTHHALRVLEECLKVEGGAGRVGARDRCHIFSQGSHENSFDDIISETIFSRHMGEGGLKKTRTKAGMANLDIAVAPPSSTTISG